MLENMNIKDLTNIAIQLGVDYNLSKEELVKEIEKELSK